MNNPNKSTTLFTAGLNVFGLLIIEFVKLIDRKTVNLEIPQNLDNSNLLWSGIFQGGLLLLGLVFFTGRVDSSHHHLIKMILIKNLVLTRLKVAKEDLNRTEENLRRSTAKSEGTDVTKIGTTSIIGRTSLGQVIWTNS